MDFSVYRPSGSVSVWSTVGSTTLSSVSVGAGSTTSVESATLVSELNGYYDGWYLQFTSGVNYGISRLITNYTVSGGPPVATFTVNVFPQAYSTGDPFIITSPPSLIYDCTPVFKKATISRYALGQVGLAQITLDNPDNQLTGLFNYANILKCYINAKEVFEGRLDTCKQTISPTEGQYMTLTAKDYGQDLLRKIEFYMQNTLTGSVWVNNLLSDLQSELTPVYSGSNLQGDLALNILNAFGFDATKNICETANTDYFATVDKKLVITDPGLNDSGVQLVLNLNAPNNPAYNIKQIDFDEFDGLELGNQIYGLAGDYDESWLNTGSTISGSASSQITSAGQQPWVNLQNLYVDDEQYAYFTGENGPSLPLISQMLYVTGSSGQFNIPNGVEITGLTVTIKRHYTVPDPTALSHSYVQDAWIQLIVNGTPMGNVKGYNGDAWYFYNGQSIADEYKIFGNSSDMWGLTTSNLSPANLNSPNFGVAIQAYITNPTGGIQDYATGYIDVVEFTAYFGTATPNGEEFGCTEETIQTCINNDDWTGSADTGTVTITNGSTGFSPLFSQYYVQARENSYGTGQRRIVRLEVNFPCTTTGSWGGDLGNTGSTMTGSYNFVKMHHKNMTFCMGGLYLNGDNTSKQPSGSIYVRDTWGNEIVQSGSYNYSFRITGSNSGMVVADAGFLYTGSRQTFSCGMNDSGSQAVWDDTLAWSWYPSGSTQYFDWSSVSTIKFEGYFQGNGYGTITLDGMMFTPMAYLNQDIGSINQYLRKELLIERTDIVSYNILKDAVDAYLNCRSGSLQQTTIEAVPTWTEQGLDLQPSSAFSLNGTYYRCRDITYNYSSDEGWTAKITAVPRYMIVDSERILSGTIHGMLGALRHSTKRLESSVGALAGG